MKIILIILFVVTTILSAKFVKNGDVVVDKESGLMWQDNIAVTMNKRVSYDTFWITNAEEYCEELNLNGYSDWRLPNVKELQSIVDISRYKPAINRAFEHSATFDYWTSVSFVDDSFLTMAVSFYYGSTSTNHYSNENYVRCVRDP